MYQCLQLGSLAAFLLLENVPLEARVKENRQADGGLDFALREKKEKGKERPSTSGPGP